MTTEVNVSRCTALDSAPAYLAADLIDSGDLGAIHDVLGEWTATTAVHSVVWQALPRSLGCTELLTSDEPGLAPEASRGDVLLDCPLSLSSRDSTTSWGGASSGCSFLLTNSIECGDCGSRGGGAARACG